MLRALLYVLYSNIIVQKIGVGTPRSGPSPRAITNAVLQNESLPNYGNTLIVMQFGQFLDHDMTITPTFTLGINFFISKSM